MAPHVRSGTRGRWVAGAVLLVGLLLGPAVRAQAPPAQKPSPPALNEKRLAEIETIFLSGDPKSAWPRLAEEGEKVIPYVAHILADPDPLADGVYWGALMFTNRYLTEYDCRSLLEPTLDLLKHDKPVIRADALRLLQKIDGKGECAPAAAVFLYAEDKAERMSAAICLSKLGGERELLALDLWLRDPSRQKDDAFDAVRKSRDALRDRLADEEKKLKTKTGEKKDGKK